MMADNNKENMTAAPAMKLELVPRGLEVAEVWDVQGVKYAGFSDSDGNLWLLQEFPANLRR